MSSRIQKIKDTYSNQLEDRLKQEKVTISLDSAWDILTSADPTKNQKNLRWLVETYINKSYLWEDIMGGPTSKVAETLVEFDKHKRNLEPSERSLTKYHTLGSLWSAIKPYVGQLTAGEEKRDERDKAYSEAEVIVDREDGFKIVVPKTEYSAKWFGRGTRWCTSADTDNMFEQYSEESPLFIIFMPDGDKLQLWKGCSSVQFMDETDDSVTTEYIEEHWNILEPVCKWTKQLKYIPEEFKDYDICMEAVKNDGWALEDVPKELRNREMYLEAIEAINQNINILHYLPDILADKEMCIEAIRKSFHALFHIPEKYIDKEICEIAINIDGMALEYVPEELRDYEMCLKAVKQNGCTLVKVSEKTIDYEMCIEAIKNNSRALEYVPEKLKDYKICMEAVRSANHDFKYINSYTLKYVPKELLDYKICMEAIKNNALSLQHVPDRFKDYEMCMIAVENEVRALDYLPEKIRDEDVFQLNIKKNENNIFIIPENLYDQKITGMKEVFQMSEPSLKM